MFLFHGGQSQSMAVKKLCDEFWTWRLKESPEFATFCGVHDYDDQLDDTSVSGYERRGVSIQTVFQGEA